MTTSVCEPFATLAQHESMAFECLLAFLTIHDVMSLSLGVFIPSTEIVDQTRATKRRDFEGEFSGALGFEDGVGVDAARHVG
jgi:hypothetical protein